MFSSNLTMMTDLYELTMMQGYFLNGNNDTVVFDMFYRTNPAEAPTPLPAAWLRSLTM